MILVRILGEYIPEVIIPKASILHRTRRLPISYMNLIVWYFSSYLIDVIRI